MTAMKNQQSFVERANATSNKRDILKYPSRIATMPIGMIKDLASGGLVAVGKNFVPRLRNIAKGTTIVNRPQAKSKQTNAEKQG